jgi:hypothetical protein
MSTDPETGSAALPLSLERQLNAACDRFEATWQAGGRPRIEDYLADCPAPAHPALLAELLALELDYRARAGEAAAPEEYRTRFPGHEAVIRAAFGAPAPSAEHAARAGGMRDACGVVPTRRLAGAALSSTLPGPLPAGGAAAALPAVPGYEVLGELGRGGMGIVYRARDVRLRRQVALKVIKPEYAADPAHRARFLREARAAAALQHDHVMTVYQVGDDQGVLFLAMPLLTGETVGARLARQPPLTTAEQLRIGREIAEGLAAAHAAGLIHRDIKPSNVWLESTPSPVAPPGRGDGGEGFRVKLLDFGLALAAEGTERLTQAGAVVGTPAYMSPEQADGQPLDGRSDLFSLGCLLYRLATGRQPFARDSVTATLRAVADHTPPPPRKLAPEVPPALSDLILRLLAKSPADRPESAAAVAAALRRIESGDTTTAPRSARPARPAGRRRAAAVVVAALAGAAALAGLALWAFQRPGPGAPPSPSPAALSYEGYVDVVVWTKAGGAPRRQRLSDEGALPLRPGDQIRIEAKVTPAAYLYLFWIDTEGEAAPVYPWDPAKGWDARPAEEAARDELSLPASETKGYTLEGNQEGMETLLLLARPSPLDAGDADVRRWFAGLVPQRPVQDARAAVWFENGKVVQHDARRRRQWFKETQIDDPVLRMQELLRERLQPHAVFTTAVSFAKQGK